MILQLNPALPVTSPKGPGIAHFLVDYGQESDLYWIVFIDETGESWMYANHEIRAQKNITLGRKLDKQSPKKTFDGFRYEPIKNSYCEVGQNEFLKQSNFNAREFSPAKSYNIDGR